MLPSEARPVKRSTLLIERSFDCSVLESSFSVKPARQAFVQGEVPEVPELERRFAHLWDMYGSSLVGFLVGSDATLFAGL